MKSNFDVWNFYGYSYGSYGSYGKKKNKDKDEYDSFFRNQFQILADAEAKRKEYDKIKKEVTTAFNNEFIPVNIHVVTYECCEIYRANGRVNIKTNGSRLMDIKSNINEIIKRVTRIPQLVSCIDSYVVLYDIYRRCKYKTPDSDAAIIAFHKGKISYEEVLKSFSPIELGEPNLGGYSLAEYIGYSIVGRLVPLKSKELYTKALNIITKKYKKNAISSMEESRRKGSRINPGFIKGTSTNPLLTRSIGGVNSGIKLPKVLIINDCSGSMGNATNPTSPSFKSCSFIAALVNSGCVDVTHAIYHSELGYLDMVYRHRAGELSTYSGGDEGFNQLSNLPEEWGKEADYIIFTTDLRYSETQQNAIFDFVSKGKAHMVLSFKDEGMLKTLNVRKVETIEDMASVVNTILR